MNSNKTVFISIVGRPNVGKSSLLNKLLGQKVAIVTDKPQTTRTKITGVLTKDDTQYVFIDTPGLHKPKTKLSNNMVKSISSSILDVDVAVLIVDVRVKLGEAEKSLIQSITAAKLPMILLINKIDTIEDKERIMSRILEYKAEGDFSEIIPISVLKDDGLDRVMSAIDGYKKDSVHYFPTDTLTDQPERIIAAELIREKLLINLQQEIPHGVAVVIERMKERGTGNGTLADSQGYADSDEYADTEISKDKVEKKRYKGKRIMDIDATIFCEKRSHKGMIIGKQGSLLKKIASDSRRDLEEFFQIQVNLKCWIKVKEDWRNRENLIKDFGLNS